MGHKLTAMLTVGDKVAVGPEAILQTVPLFAFGGLFLLRLLFLLLFLFILILILTPHILDVLERGKNGL